MLPAEEGKKPSSTAQNLGKRWRLFRQLDFLLPGWEEFTRGGVIPREPELGSGSRSDISPTAKLPLEWPTHKPLDPASMTPLPRREGSAGFPAISSTQQSSAMSKPASHARHEAAWLIRGICTSPAELSGSFGRHIYQTARGCQDILAGAWYESYVVAPVGIPESERAYSVGTSFWEGQFSAFPTKLPKSLETSEVFEAGPLISGQPGRPGEGGARCPPGPAVPGTPVG
jgi:hypothetical protein